jgi:lauroyl/myristoyl acyltransferase
VIWFKKPQLGQKGISRFLQSPFNVGLIRHFPKFATRAYIHSLGRLFFSYNSQLTERIDRHLSIATETAKLEATPDTLNQTLGGILSHYYEKLFIAFFNFKKVCHYLKERVVMERGELLDQALARGRGAILVTGHYGAVEFLPLTLALKGYPVTMLLRFKTQKLKESLMRRAKGINIELVDVEDDPRVVFTALKALKANRILITECDEFECWCRDKRRQVEFLGVPMLQDRSLEMLQRRAKAPALLGLVQRQAHERYKLRLHALESAPAKSETPSLAQQALAILEDYIRIAPHQWYQWKEADFLPANAIPRHQRPVREPDPSRDIPFADPIPHSL